MNKIEAIKKAIRNVQLNGIVHVQAKEEMEQMYCVDNAHNLDRLSEEAIKKHDWKGEVVSRAKLIQRMNLIKGRFFRLERHAFAPEMNCVHFKNGAKIPTPQIKDVLLAQIHIAKKYDLEKLRTLTNIK